MPSPQQPGLVGHHLLTNGDSRVVVRQAWYLHGQPVLRTELAAVTADVDPEAFTITPAPGVRVVSGGPPEWLAGSPREMAWGAAKGAARVAAELGIRWMKRYQP
jgi:hypothetical protein